MQFSEVVGLVLKRGVLVNVVSERLGHSSPVVTMTVYQHVLLACGATPLRLSARRYSIGDALDLYGCVASGS